MEWLNEKLYSPNNFVKISITLYAVEYEYHKKYFVFDKVKQTSSYTTKKVQEILDLS